MHLIQADMASQHIIIVGSPVGSQQAGVALLHFVDHGGDPVAESGGGSRMARRLSAERLVRLVGPFQIGLLEESLQ